MRKLPAVRVDSQYFAMDGGFDQTTPPLKMLPGALRDALNFECDINGGYARIEGIERYDGRASPSDATYSTIPATITGSWAVGDTLTGATSGATGVLIASNANGFLATMLSGTFQDAENLQISAVTVATCNGAQYTGGAATGKLDAQYLNLAADQYRALIQAVPGSGAVRGVWAYNDVLYAFRDNAGATACVMHKKTASGWSAVTLFNEISFTAGSGDIDEGDTLTQGANTATIKRLIITSGTLGAGTAAGRLIVTTPAPGNFAAGAATTTGAGALTLSGAQTAISFLPGGRFEFDNVNFGGTVAQKRMYGCDGTNRAFEFDGTTLAPITTGMSPDTPKFVAGHKNHLFLAFGASLQHSGIGTPYVWSAVLGAAELATGDTVTGLNPMIGSDSSAAMLITTRGQSFMLYGSSAADWNLINMQSEGGAFAYTVQLIGNAVMLDDRGVTQLGATQAFGNFEQATISHKVQTWVRQQKSRAVASCVAREKNQYRLFCSDSYALYVTMNGRKVVGMMPVLFTHDVTCVCSNEWSDGSERMFFGSSDGYVYEMDKGTSLDGDPIDFRAVLAFNHAKSPRVDKTWRSAAIEMSGGAYAEFQVGYTLGYGDAEIEQPAEETLSSSLTNVPVWDEFTWDEFTWDGQSLMPSEMSLDGTAENISLAISGSSDYVSAFTLTGCMYHYTLRGRKR